jgi:hypothetical protein
MNSGISASAGPTGVYPSPPGIKSPGEDSKMESSWEPEYRETFSKGMLKMRMQEYQGGKYTKRYIDAYLEFMHLSGMISNLDYLEFKNILLKE